jgi:two-component sensor histidine kinase
MNFQLRGLLAVTALIVMSTLITATARWLWRLLPERTATWMRVALFTLIALPIAMLSAWIMTIITGFDILTPVRLTSWVVITLVAHWTVTLVFTVNALLQQLGVELRASVEELKREVIALNNTNRQLQKAVSRVLHGPVQEAIASSLIRLQSQPAAFDDPEFVNTIQSRINSALDLLNRPTQSQTNLRALFDDLAEMWSDVVNIQCSASESDLDLLNAHQVTAYSVAEIVREGCSNAIRHGDARTISVAIAVDELDRSVNLRIENSGRPLSLDAVPGIGSQLLEEITLSWNRVQVGTQVRLDARIPLSEPDSAQL